MTSTELPGGRTRRAFLGALATGAGLSVAGCSGGGSTTAGGDATDADGTGTGGSGDGGRTLPTPVAGNPEADVTLAVYEDYACPHCANYNVEGFPEISTQYIEPGRIRYEHHDFPIPVANPGSWEAANAARAVQDRAGDDAFYTYAGRLFENSDRIRSDGPGLYESIATDIGFDGAAIRQAAVDKAYQATVRGDRSAGIELGVSSTPTFVIDGSIAAKGWGPGMLSRLESVIDEALGGNTA